MKEELYPFQKRALKELRMKAAEAVYRYNRTHSKQVISFTAPTGAGKTIIMAALMESIFFGNEDYPEQPEAIIVWLSDSPQLNEQSKDKIDFKADKIRIGQCVTVKDESFDQEILDDGHIYFLNTQKLGKSSNLTKATDNRQYTIWETLANTAREKSDRVYFIIDEAHRGMQGREAGRATTIMQKFLKGSPEDGIEAMPVVIGMSATSARFNALVSGIPSDTQYVVVTTEEVRSSGLLKDRIVISYPEENTGKRDMAVLQAAADEWRDKREHWYQYCNEQHSAHVNPVFVIQVQNATASSVSATDLDECIQKIEERAGLRFHEGEVVHAFGDASTVLQINGLRVPYVASASIAEDKRICVVFFKESLSTGWDCPRAETMMSFRHAADATYIAQLLGRMIRTPKHMHIQVDETLNDVHLYLPHFNSETVRKVVEELQNAEGGEIPADIYGESLDARVMDTLSVRPGRRAAGQGMHSASAWPGQTSLFEPPSGGQPMEVRDGGAVPYSGGAREQAENPACTGEALLSPETGVGIRTGQPGTAEDAVQNAVQAGTAGDALQNPVQTQAESAAETYVDPLDRESVVKAVNMSGLLSYDVRTTRVNNYLNSLYSLSRLLRQSGKYPDATDDVLEEIVRMIRAHVEELKHDGKYEEMIQKIMEFQMKSQVFDVFGESVDNHIVHMFMSATDADIDRQFRRAEIRLGNEGAGNKYGRYYYDEADPNTYKIDVIFYASNDHCYERLLSYAEKTFHKLNDHYRRQIVGLEERFIRQYNTIVSDGDIVSKHNFRLPETISLPHEADGREYTDHLFVDDAGKARIALNGWEEGVLAEEQRQPDYVCWLRNPPRKPWSLCIPYEAGGKQKPTYPDFIIIRKDDNQGYILDILEPHDHTRTDNLGKAKGFAEYARQNPGVGRIQLIRKGRDGAGNNQFKRLDMAMSAVRDKVSRAMTNDELDHIFETDGFFM
jgi:type III restriction enzyme